MTKWWQEEMIYQIYPKSFKDSNGDGIGDINGIREKLPYLKDLGITMLWICPIFKSPMIDNGYDISDYQDINPDFGTLEDLENLIEDSKKVGIKIILDLVVNHSSDDHPWFQEALADPDSKYRDYYIFKKSVDGRPPNNWRSIFGGSVWEKVRSEDMYYLHTFDKRQPDLNFENPELRREIHKMINWWLDRGIAGFRIDSITFIKKDQDYLSLEADGVDGLVTCKHKMRNRPGISEFLHELKQETFNKYDCVTVGEAPGVGYDEFGDYIGEDGYFSMIFDFKYADIDVESGSDWFKRTDWTVKEFRDLIFQSQEAIQKVGWGANFIENHDQPRAISKLIREPQYQNYFGGSALALMYLFLRGTPFLYQGQEIGATNFTRQFIEQFDDISSIDNYYRSMSEGFTKEEALNFVNLRSRDNTRTPMQWDSSRYAGFSTHTPWLETNENYETINVASQENDSESLLSFYRMLISTRNTSEYRDTLIYGDIKPIYDTKAHIISYYREHSTETLQVIVNMSSDETSMEIQPFTSIISNYKGIKNNDGSITLRPYEAMLIKLN
ncbi:alpha-glucosidase [Salinicoccus hispanicus]|uniref:Glucohydrolase n=1 Tax=Salinicoccus hispanicus TaxID=157225 RepID=A0A6N8U4S4_9STAP|nr:alpha-glucosidase [Salinicoccus hispanicus]MXQ51281.1 glucohydrolase [Salinicoccus hispanicus]